jgi:multidrug resistance efflux pump
MIRSRTTKSVVGQSQQVSQVIKNNKCLTELNAKKTELITIMSGYLTQTKTRVETVTSLDALLSKIA